MLSDITIGQYFPGDSFLHRMDPRVKVILLFFFLIGIFVFDTAGSYAVLSLLTVGLFLLSRVPLRMMVNPCGPFFGLSCSPS